MTEAPATDDRPGPAPEALLDAVLGDYRLFIERVVEYLRAQLGAGADLPAWEMDHICYRVETDEQYQSTKSALLGLGGALLIESLIGGRPISIIQLREPIVHNGVTVRCIELPSPKEGSFYRTGLEHAEMVVGQPSDGCVSSKVRLEEFMRSYPGCSFDTRAIGKEINADVSLGWKDEMFGKMSCKFHLRPIYEVVEYEKQHGL
eukprot:gb/GFBE01026627.1/.p1 GENE.gb/GFBE01026627.1/~~gb/GFBE01026627.1/.p1  ORF type:complete len:204 (+),score=32.63 gb/GFBE01026627.1/:1-612(+)